MICVSLARTRHRMVLAEHKALAERGAELVELRIDYLKTAPDVGRLLKDRPTPTVVTCRRPPDGGRWSGSEEQRLMLLRTAIISGAEYVDLEYDIAKKVPRYGKTKRIVSYHNFSETPDNVEEFYDLMTECDPDIIKVVTTANSPADCVRLLKIASGSKIPTIAFCMGEFGVMSRILCGKYGAPFTYATFSAERELAPGQLSFEEMRDLYHYDRINSETQLFGVLGDPIGHSLSPRLHNAAMAEIGFNGVYVPIRVAKDQLSGVLDAFEWLDFQGLSVTIPHKEAVAEKYAGGASQAVREIGAANTLYRDANNVWQAENTDYQAAMDCLKLGLREGETFEGKRVLILGSGGVARAIALGLSKAGAVLQIAGRGSSKTAKLAEELGCRHVTWENRGVEFADILVNCTPVGMHPNMDDTPFQENWLRDDMLVFDTIYNPENTLLLKQARAHGCRTVSGLEMFVRQAAGQFKLFTGHDAPLETLGATLRRAISAARY